jgi:formylglycine-generating enzyme required for sulfatase activity
VTWYEAYAFCIWDGAFLPSEAEWNYAATGGGDQRVYPWSSPPTSSTIDCSYANYLASDEAGSYDCASSEGGAATRVGSESPKGDGKWGQADLAGNVMEWTLDYFANYVASCPNCAYLTSTSARVVRGGSYEQAAAGLLASARSAFDPTTRFPYLGVRCGRTP